MTSGMCLGTHKSCTLMGRYLMLHPLEESHREGISKQWKVGDSYIHQAPVHPSTMPPGERQPQQLSTAWKFLPYETPPEGATWVLPIKVQTCVPGTFQMSWFDIPLLSFSFILHINLIIPAFSQLCSCSYSVVGTVSRLYLCVYYFIPIWPVFDGNFP